MADKLVLTQNFVDRLHEEALARGRSEEWWQKWLEDCVIILEPIPDDGYFEWRETTGMFMSDEDARRVWEKRNER